MDSTTRRSRSGSKVLIQFPGVAGQLPRDADAFPVHPQDARRWNAAQRLADGPRLVRQRVGHTASPLNTATPQIAAFSMISMTRRISQSRLRACRYRWSSSTMSCRNDASFASGGELVADPSREAIDPLALAPNLAQIGRTDTRPARQPNTGPHLFEQEFEVLQADQVAFPFSVAHEGGTYRVHKDRGDRHAWKELVFILMCANIIMRELLRSISMSKCCELISAGNKSPGYLCQPAVHRRRAGPRPAA